LVSATAAGTTNTVASTNTGVGAALETSATSATSVVAVAAVVPESNPNNVDYRKNMDHVSPRV